MKKIDELIRRIIERKSPVVVGLDPVLERIPSCYKDKYSNFSNEFRAVGEILFEYNKDIIDTISGLVPAVKPQIAFYEAYGIEGLIAFERTVQYAKIKDLSVIEDGKRNDISSTAMAYAKGHLGTTNLLKNSKKVFDVDFLTVTPYLGRDGIVPFFDMCREYDKGIFVLVKTSNPSGFEVQNARMDNGEYVYEAIATYVHKLGEQLIGQNGYSSLGAVVGATFPSEASKIRTIMKNNFFLVPGYGTQGGKAKSVVPCFNSDGLGALVNSSRGILYSYQNKENSTLISRKTYLEIISEEVNKINDDIVSELRKTYSNMVY